MASETQFVSFDNWQNEKEETKKQKTNNFPELALRLSAKLCEWIMHKTIPAT